MTDYVGSKTCDFNRMELSMVTRHGFPAALEDDIKRPMTTLLQSNHTPGTPKSTLSSIRQAIITTDDASDHFDAGSRMTGTYELLELCLLELPIRDLLLAQRVSRRFNAVINTSPRLREKLFFTSRLAFGRAFKAKLNPLLVREEAMRAIPLFFDHREKRLACCFQEGYTRLYCRSIMATTVWVYMEFSSDAPSSRQSGEEKHLTRTLERGSWEQMFVSQPSCFVSWRVQLSGPVRETYSGILKGARTMISLLGGLEDSLGAKQ